jgi:hypothetical protein
MLPCRMKTKNHEISLDYTFQTVPRLFVKYFVQIEEQDQVPSDQRSYEVPGSNMNKEHK